MSLESFGENASIFSKWIDYFLWGETGGQFS